MAKKKPSVTPLMRQYESIKQKHPDALLLFRVGDFYETFGEDAVRTAQILNIVLTNRNNGGERTELAGFPHHSLNTYLPKLVKAGQRVAICDQLEDPKLTKKIVKRGVTELVTPGVALNDEVLQSRSNNFLCAIHFSKLKIGIAFLDISTGEFLTSQGNKEYIDKLLQNFSPSEVLVSKPHKTKFVTEFGDRFHSFYLENWLFKIDYAVETLNAHFKTTSLKGFGIDHLEEGLIASGAIMHYLSETRHDKLQHINTVSRISEEAYVWMDRFTIRNLELYHGNAQESVTLLDVIDKTITPMGSRLLKRWLSLPLKQIDKINERLHAVEFLKHNQILLQDLQHQLKQISDLERLISKIATQKVNPRELLQLKDSLDAILPIKQALSSLDNESLKVIADNIHPCDLLRSKIETAIHDNAPVVVSKGYVIAKGYNNELDELRQLAFSGKDYLDEMLERESRRTGISKLKIGSNNVFGYYLEVRHAHKDKVPEDWIRKQTLVNAERYITEELKTYEAKILSAEEKINGLESHLYEAIITWCQDYIKPVQQNAMLVSKLDVLSAFAQLSIEDRYNKPEITEDFSLNITQGRHPVIEQQLPEGEVYIANDVFLDRDDQQIIMITGPNMSGKSALLRQTAIIVLLAQIGCFVPAESAQIGIVDKIFTRVGASDNISMGESTFMVEMNETASILNNISKRSLVLLDEIGRGTSTYDGISIAWAITEYLHEHPSKAKTLFATHYHELNEMTHQFQRIKNFNVSIKEYKDNILFLRTLKPGGSAHSFGIHVAKMAGMPQHVIRKAEKVLKKLEEAHAVDDHKEVLQHVNLDTQLSFFQLDDPLLESIKDEIVNLDIDTLTPVEALMKLNEIKRLLRPDK